MPVTTPTDDRHSGLLPSRHSPHMTSSPRPSRASLLVVMSFAGSTFAVPATAGASSSLASQPDSSATRDGAARPSHLAQGREVYGRNGRNRKKASAKTRAKTPADAPATTASRARRTSVQTKRRRAGGQHALAVARSAAAPVAKLGGPPPLVPSPGPSSTPEALRAQDQAARGQIERAASAARRPALTDRWQTVSFLLSGVDGTRYPEATFWRALAAYRRGDLDGGDKIRLRSTPLAPADVGVLDGERSTASLLAARAQGHSADGDGTEVAAQPAASGFRRAAYVPGASSPASGVLNDTPYAGPAPTAAAPSIAAN